MLFLGTAFATRLTNIFLNKISVVYDMKKRHIKIISFILFTFGILLLFNSNILITGAAIGFSETPSSSILGIVLILASILVFIGNRNLELIINKDISKIKRNRDLFVEHNYITYKEHLEKTGQMPTNLNEKEKSKYARQKLMNLTDPIIEYNEKNAIEFCEYFGSTPVRESTAKKEEYIMKARVHYAINDSVLEKITEEAAKNNVLWKASERIIYYLTKTGQLGSYGKTFKYVPDTDQKYFYMRDISTGARIFLRVINNNEYELIGVSKGTQKKREEIKAIKRIQQIHCI